MPMRMPSKCKRHRPATDSCNGNRHKNAEKTFSSATAASTTFSSGTPASRAYASRYELHEIRSIEFAACNAVAASIAAMPA